jgi:hypothetical protein
MEVSSPDSSVAEAALNAALVALRTSVTAMKSIWPSLICFTTQARNLEPSLERGNSLPSETLSEFN